MEKSEGNIRKDSSFDEDMEEAHEPQLVTKERLQQLVREVLPNAGFDDRCEDIMREIIDDFMKKALYGACLMAKHRKSKTLEAKDLQVYLERRLNISIPSFGKNAFNDADPKQLRKDEDNV